MELANWNKIKEKRFELHVEGYTETDSDEPYFLTPYFGELPENIDSDAKNKIIKNSSHQAYFVEQPPFSTVPAHYHDTNQFQVFLEGKAVFGKKYINSVTIHYAGGHTPYGPIVTEKSSIKYLTLRNNWDSGGKKMPEQKKNLISVPRVFFLSDKISFKQKINRKYIEEIYWDKSTHLGISLFYLPKDSSSDFSFPKMGYGKYCLVLLGSILYDSSDIEAQSCFYLRRDEIYNFKSGREGAIILSMQFPIEPI
ncbi:MAG: hypothetical protein CFH01_01849 [Alphaproteobacteria bacterium MarineAlpha2_Bin1]|nr:MAG: hypothetical protein CFH01_01849 [Alphaproteobacteria bacterium MarineAlpha2_Bin1]